MQRRPVLLLVAPRLMSYRVPQLSERRVPLPQQSLHRARHKQRLGRQATSSPA